MATDALSIPLFIADSKYDATIRLTESLSLFKMPDNNAFPSF